MFLERGPKARGKQRTQVPPLPDGSYPILLHVDMDAFFASVEERSDPRLHGLPLVVGGGPEGRGVVTTASYPARAFGIRSGMGLSEAKRRCPSLLVLPVDPPKFVHESIEVLRILDGFSPRVEAASIDEAYVEFPAEPMDRWESKARAKALEIQQAILDRRRLPASVGAAPVKLQAKMASGRAKPFGVQILPPGRFLDLFREEPVSVIPGAGPKTVEALAGMGIFTIGQLAEADPARLVSRFGVWGKVLGQQARGAGEPRVLAGGEEPDAKSAGHETTFHQDIEDPAFLRATVCLLADRVARRLRLQGARARTVAVRHKVGMTRYSRQQALSHPTDDAVTLVRIAWDLLERSRKGRALRLVGVAGMRLVFTSVEAPLLVEDAKRRAATITADRLRSRFGESTVLPGEVFRRSHRKP